MSEKSSSEAIALRREARRRKILQNAENRLRTITGRASSSSYDEPKPNNIFHSLHNDLHSENSCDPFEDINQELSTEGNIFKEISALKEAFQYNPDEEVRNKTPIRVKKSYLELFVEKRIHYIVLSMIVYILLFFKLGFLFYNNIFCPFITVKLMEYITMQATVESTTPNIFSLVPSLSKGHIITYLFKTYSILRNIFSDFFLYMFFFVLSDKLLNAGNEIYKT